MDTPLVDHLIFPILKGENISVPKAHLKLLLELLEAGKVEQVEELLKNLLNRQQM